MENHALVQMVERHERVLYRGDERKPGITARLEIGERALSEMRDDIKDIRGYFKTVVVLITGTILTVIGDIVVRALHL